MKVALVYIRLFLADFGLVSGSDPKPTDFRGNAHSDYVSGFLRRGYRSGVRSFGLGKRQAR